MMTSNDTHTTHDAEEDVRNREIQIYINGSLFHRDDAKVSVYDSGFLLGDGMWEGMRLYNGKWAFFDDHMDRFFNSCKAVDLEVGMDKAGILAALTMTAKANNMTAARQRRMLKRFGLDPAGQHKTHMRITGHIIGFGSHCERSKNTRLIHPNF